MKVGRKTYLWLGLATLILILSFTWNPIKLRLLGALQVPVAIRDVQQTPGIVNGWVTMQGTVGDRAPLINAQVYELKDPSGQIWVLTSDSTPAAGTRIKVRGRVRFESIVIEGMEMGELYLEAQGTPEIRSES